MRKWLQDILRDPNGKYSVNRPFYIVFMILFIASYIRTVWKTNQFPNIPTGTLVFIAFLYGYEVVKKFLYQNNGGS